MTEESRFIPVDLVRIVEDLLELVRREGESADAYARVFDLYVATFQRELAAGLRDLRTRYHPYDPDAETLPSHAAPARSPETLAATCADLRDILERANFEELSHAELQVALQKTSPRGLQVYVDLSAFEVLGFWVRGHDVRTDDERRWRGGLPQRVQVETPIYRRLCVFAKLVDDGEDPGAAPPTYQAARDDDLLRTDCVYVKLFRDIAHPDLEMLLPNTRVRMTFADKLKLGVTGGGGTVGGLVATVTKVGVATNPLTWGLALAGFAGVLWRQVSKVFHQRVRYMAALSRKLYCRNLDNNFGAITRLVELAREEECKESLLAWCFLVRRGVAGATPAELDVEVEGHLREVYGARADFEIADALDKLREAGLVESGAGGVLVALDPEEAAERLGRAWAAPIRA